MLQLQSKGIAPSIELNRERSSLIDKKLATEVLVIASYRSHAQNLHVNLTSFAESLNGRYGTQRTDAGSCLLNIASTSYLVPILRKQQVAQIRGSPIYVITLVGLIPLSSQLEARKAIEQTKKEIQAESDNQPSNNVVDDDSSADEGSYHSDGHITDDSLKDPKSLSPPYDTTRRKSQEADEGVAQDVTSKRGQYGRFAEKWFSRKGWTFERRRAQGMSPDDAGKPKSTQPQEKSISDRFADGNENSSKEQERQNDTATLQASRNVQTNAPNQRDVTSTLLPKLLRTTKMLFASHSFFFSYDYDITRRLGNHKAKTPGLPLHRTVDPLVSHGIELVETAPATNASLVVLLEPASGVTIH
ncbi:MAG: hypothetical protein Q9225_004174 [Loekoesia sp. 1 TL-2023]